MKALFKNNALILSLYLVMLMISGFFLLNHGKVQIHAYLNQMVGNKFLDVFFGIITYLGDGFIACFLLISIGFYNLRLGICCIISFLAAFIVSYILKHGFYDEVMRPSFVFDWYVKTPLKFVSMEKLNIHNSFPSGHSTQAFAIFMCLAFFSRKYLMKFLFLFIALLTAFSRVYLSQHWLIDITIGSIIEVSTAILIYYFIISKNKFSKLNEPVLKLKAS